MNVKNMFAGTSTSSTGDRRYVEIQQMWCGPVDYFRCEVRQQRKLGCRLWAAWHVECEDGSSRRNTGRADLADWRRGWGVHIAWCQSIESLINQDGEEPWYCHVISKLPRCFVCSVLFCFMYSVNCQMAHVLSTFTSWPVSFDLPENLIFLVQYWRVRTFWITAVFAYSRWGTI